MDMLRSPSHEAAFSAKTQVTETVKPSASRLSWLKKTTKAIFVLPTIRFLLGAVFGLTVTVTICFFPFPKGKFLSFIAAPITLVFAHFMDKYTNTSVCMPTTAIKILQGKASLSTAFIVYLGMYFGSSYVIDQFHYAIETSPPKDRQYMQLIVEKLYFGMNETVSGRLQQVGIVTAFFYALEHTYIRAALHVMSFVWLVILPEMNPAIAMGFFGGTEKLSGEDRARFWVNFVFLVIICSIGIKISEYILRLLKSYRTKPKQN